jgi:hypothetical protein
MESHIKLNELENEIEMDYAYFIQVHNPNLSNTIFVFQLFQLKFILYSIFDMNDEYEIVWLLEEALLYTLLFLRLVNR